MQTIPSRDHPKLKAVRSLIRSKKERQRRGCFVMEGMRSLEAFLGGVALPQYRIKEIWVSAHSTELATRFDLPVYVIEHPFMEQLSDVRTTQGILGVVTYTPVPLEINPEQGSYLLLDHLMDPGNLGSLIRSAVAFKLDGVFLYGDCVDVFNPKTVRATMGALPFINPWKITTLSQSVPTVNRLGNQNSYAEPSSLPNGWNSGDKTFQRLEKMGYELLSTVMRNGENLQGTIFGKKNVLVIGNEANGISEGVSRHSVHKLSIPISGNVESLNAAVAGSICMFVMSKN